MSEQAKEREIPAGLIVVGLALYVLSAFLHTGAGGVGPTILAVVIIGSLQTILLIAAAFIVATLLSVSFGDARSAALKFSGAVLASGGLGALLPMGGLIALFVFLGLLMWLFELELTYAIVLTVVYFVVSFVVGIIAAAALA